MNDNRATWRISGMHCPHCETTVLRAVSGLEGLKDTKVDYRNGTLSAQWDSAALPETIIAERIAEAGYNLKPLSPTLSAGQKILRLAILITILTGLFALLTLTTPRLLLASFPVARAGMSLGALFMIGLMTSVHCVAMCGGINLAQSAVAAQAGLKIFRANWQYNLGRIISYTVVGGIVGAIGSAFSMSAGTQAAIQITAAIFMVLMALNLLDIGTLRGLTPRLPNGLRNRLMKSGGNSSLTVGLLNGLMPCGPLQTMQIYALSAGSWWMGALSMLCFCLGTVPLMLGFGLISGKLNRRFTKPMRIASGILVLIMGMMMLSNGMALSGLSLRCSASDDITNAINSTKGVQVIRSELDYRGFPDITVKAGMLVRWIIHADADKLNGCNNEMVIPALNLRVPLSAGDNVVEFTANEPGVISYTCWMGMLNGSITVKEK